MIRLGLIISTSSSRLISTNPSPHLCFTNCGVKIINDVRGAGETGIERVWAEDGGAGGWLPSTIMSTNVCSVEMISADICWCSWCCYKHCQPSQQSTESRVSVTWLKIMSCNNSSHCQECSGSCLVSQPQQESVLKVRPEQNIGSGSFKLRKSLGKHSGMFFLVKYSQETEEEFVPSLFHICGVREIQINRN